MKLLVVHPFAVVPTRQDFYARVQGITDWELTIVTPNRWKTDFGETIRARRSPAYHGSLVALPVVLAGHIPLHAYVARLAPLVRRERPDVVYVYHEPYGVATFQAFLASSRAGLPSLGFYSSQNIAKRYPWPFSAGERFVYRRATFAIAPASGAADVLREKGYAGPVEVIQFGIDPDIFHPDGPLDEGGLRSGTDTLTIGYVGRLVPEKGVETLLEALALLPARNFKAIIAGTGPSERALKRRTAQLGLVDRVTWGGYVPYEETPSVYRGIDVLVLPSRTAARWKEQFGRVVIEAVACGACVAAADSGELPRVIAATHGGWTFPEGDPEALAGRLERLQASPSELAECRRRGHATVLERFHIDVVARRFANALAAQAPT